MSRKAQAINVKHIQNHNLPFEKEKQYTQTQTRIIDDRNLIKMLMKLSKLKRELKGSYWDDENREVKQSRIRKTKSLLEGMVAMFYQPRIHMVDEFICVFCGRRGHSKKYIMHKMSCRIEKTARRRRERRPVEILPFESDL